MSGQDRLVTITPQRRYQAVCKLCGILTTSMADLEVAQRIADVHEAAHAKYPPKG